MRIPLAASGLRQKDIDKAIETLNSGNLTMGARVREFEIAMAKYLNSRHFVMVNSGSSANLLMIEALMRPTNGKPKLDPGDSILLPAIAWPTTVWPVIQLGLNPVFVDVEPENLFMDLNLAQEIIDNSSSKIRGLFPIHPLGRAIPNRMLREFSAKNQLVLINDVCESLGSWDGLLHAGTEGIASSYSFYFSHHITTMEGGGISTDNNEFADDLRSMRSHGWSRDREDALNWNKNLTINDSKFLFVSTGYNVRPMEIQAAIGLSQLQDIDKFVTKRRAIANQISKILNGSSLKVLGNETLESRVHERSNSWMLIPIRIKGENASLRKALITDYLNAQGVETRPVLTGNFLSQPAIQYILKNSVDADKFVNASQISREAFLVGAHHDMDIDQIDFLANTLLAASHL
jgi:CDP-6-deoxy-D-xylo-4-hexulose-3-dehydrase